MLSNAYFLAKIRFDTAENEPAKNLQNFKFAEFANFADTNPLTLRRSAGAAADAHRARRARRGLPDAPGLPPGRDRHACLKKDLRLSNLQFISAKLQCIFNTNKIWGVLQNTL